VTVLAACAWRDNAELIAAVHDLGYLRDTDHVLDPTYGKGNWWKQWRPEQLTTYHRAADGSDFRHLDLADNSVDAVAYDPPYCCPGGRRTSTISDMHEAFGMDEQERVGKSGEPDPMFRTPAALQAIIDAGLTEMVRVCRPATTKTRGGIILVKCMSYVWGGTFWPGTELTWQHATSTLGLVTVDRLDIVKRAAGPQPKTNRNGSARRQSHAANNASRLWVFRVPKAPKPIPPSLDLDLDG